MKKKNCGYRRKLFVSLMAVVLASLFSSAVYAQEAWKTWIRSEPVEETKVWKITFNQPVDVSSINDETVYIENSLSQRIPLQRVVTECSVAIKPRDGKYASGERYTLFVRQVRARGSGGIQRMAVKMPFQIKNTSKPYQNMLKRETMLAIINQERAKAGALPLVFREEVFAYADIRAQEIVHKFSHTRPDGTRALDGLPVPYSWAGENIAAGNETAEATMEQFMNSPGHRKNILNPNYTQVAIGYHYDPYSTYKHHWVQLFLAP